MRTKGLGHLKLSKDHTGNLTWDLASCGAMPQPPAAPLAPYRLHTPTELYVRQIQSGFSFQVL